MKWPEAFVTAVLFLAIAAGAWGFFWMIVSVEAIRSLH